MPAAYLPAAQDCAAAEHTCDATARTATRVIDLVVRALLAVAAFAEPHGCKFTDLARYTNLSAADMNSIMSDHVAVTQSQKG